jgi:hypothetical protein
MDFERFWAMGIKILRDFVAATENGKNHLVERWGMHTGLTGQKFPIVDADPREIKCLSMNASKKISIPKSDMKRLYDVWESYVDGKITRMRIIEIVPRPTYCVSLMKHLKEKIRV